MFAGGKKKARTQASFFSLIFPIHSERDCKEAIPLYKHFLLFHKISKNKYMLYVYVFVYVFVYVYICICI